jgi:hypothetical protein
VSQGPSVSTDFGWNWLTKRFEGSLSFIFIDLSLACGFHSVVGALGLFACASDPAVTSDAGQAGNIGRALAGPSHRRFSDICDLTSHRVEPDSRELFRATSLVNLGIEELRHGLIVEPDAGCGGLLANRCEVLNTE